MPSQRGHPYWGWRFAGWALHYIQDLTQPYHASVLPGVGVPTMLWINTLDLAGFHTRKVHAVNLVTNRHLAIENYQLYRLRDAYLRGRADDAALRALRDTSGDGRIGPYTDASPRDVVTRDAHAYADTLDAMLERSLPAPLHRRPSYVFGETEPGIDLHALVARSAPAAEPAHHGEPGAAARRLRRPDAGLRARARHRPALTRRRVSPGLCGFGPALDCPA